MRNMTPLVLIVALLAWASPSPATERETRTEISWSGSLPRAAEDEEGNRIVAKRPILVYVANEIETRDQTRFDTVVLKNETFEITTKFFDCVRISDSRAREHPLLDDLRVAAPFVVVFDSTLEKRVVAGGRASAMKLYGVMCQVGQLDYEKNIGATVRAARNLLATFDQFDAANGAMGIKEGRIADAQGKGNLGKVRQLQAELEQERAENKALFDKAEESWQEIWRIGLLRKER